VLLSLTFEFHLACLKMGDIKLNESELSFQFNAEWNNSLEEQLKNLIESTWKDWGFDETDEEFVAFVLVSLFFSVRF
jgi:hypothetical protein